MRDPIDREDVIRILRERARLLVNAAKAGQMRMDNESQAALAACVLLLAVLEDDIKELEGAE